MSNKQDFLDLALFCADVCRALRRALDGSGSDEVSESVQEAIRQLKK